MVTETRIMLILTSMTASQPKTKDSITTHSSVAPGFSQNNVFSQFTKETQ